MARWPAQRLMDQVLAAVQVSKAGALYDCEDVSRRLLMSASATATNFYRLDAMVSDLRSPATSGAGARVKVQFAMMELWAQGYRVGRAHQAGTGVVADLPEPLAVARFWWLLYPDQRWPDRAAALDELAVQAERLGFAQFALMLRAGDESAGSGRESRG